MGVAIPQDTLIDLALNDESANVKYLALQALPLDPTLRWVADPASHDSYLFVDDECFWKDWPALNRAKADTLDEVEDRRPKVKPR